MTKKSYNPIHKYTQKSLKNTELEDQIAKLTEQLSKANIKLMHRAEEPRYTFDTLDSLLIFADYAKGGGPISRISKFYLDELKDKAEWLQSIGVVTNASQLSAILQKIGNYQPIVADDAAVNLLTPPRYTPWA